MNRFLAAGVLAVCVAAGLCAADHTTDSLDTVKKAVALSVLCRQSAPVENTTVRPFRNCAPPIRHVPPKCTGAALPLPASPTA